MKKAVFLDRDGTINVDYGYVHEIEKFELLQGVEESLKNLQEMGYLLIIVTNQSGIGRGYFSEKKYLDFQDYIDEYFKMRGIKITAQYYCPHTDEDHCSCRKPKIGLFEKAAKEYDIDWKQSFAIGDRMRDLIVCEEKGMTGFLISDSESLFENSNIKAVTSMKEIVAIIKNLNEK